jgi:hypothetical protein
MMMMMAMTTCNTFAYTFTLLRNTWNSYHLYSHNFLSPLFIFQNYQTRERGNMHMVSYRDSYHNGTVTWLTCTQKVQDKFYQGQQSFWLVLREFSWPLQAKADTLFRNRLQLLPSMHISIQHPIIFIPYFRLHNFLWWYSIIK